MKHALIKTGDPDVFEQIQDRNGEVVLGYCRRCGQSEGTLEDECVDWKPVAKAMLEADDADPDGTVIDDFVKHYHKGNPDGMARALETIARAAIKATIPPVLAPVRTEPGADGSKRKAHYGPGKQPWDTSVEFGWGPHAAGFCVLRYLRRDKAVEHSRESAQWYYKQLVSRARMEREMAPVGVTFAPWTNALARLDGELTPEEKELLL